MIEFLPEVKRIVLTGGPCGGKTKALQVIKKNFEQKHPDIQLILVSELATDIFNSGFDPAFIFGRPDLEYHLQKEMIVRQLATEKFFTDSSFSKYYFRSKGVRKVVVIFDRGVADMTVYLDHKRLPELMSELKLNTVDTHHHYDGVIHLVTAANGVYCDFEQRHEKEDKYQAIKLDENIIKTWSNHEKLVVVPNIYQGTYIKFETKLDLVVRAIESMINNREVEQRFWLPGGIPKSLFEKSLAHSRKLISQNYLKSEAVNVSNRIRGIRDSFADKSYFHYTRTNKMVLANKDSGRYEKEEIISAEQYKKLFDEFRDEKYQELVKERHNIILGSEYDYDHWVMDLIMKPETCPDLVILEYENILKDKVLPPKNIFGLAIDITDKISSKDLAKGIRYADMKEIFNVK